MSLAYCNGDFVQESEIAVSPLDRSFLFGDGLYEVMRVYHGKPFQLQAHLNRLQAGAAALRLNGVPTDLEGAIDQLLRINGVEEGQIYLHLSRGAAPRSHSFHSLSTTPFLFITVAAKDYGPLRRLRLTGVDAILHEDLRWKRRDIKSVNLLGNCIAKSAADRLGAFEAILHENGYLTEGSHTNVFALIGQTLVTTPLGSHILPGITRHVVLDLAKQKGLETAERCIRLDEIHQVSELFLTGTTSELLPVIRLDGNQIGGGVPGSVTRCLIEDFDRFVSSTVLG